MSHSITPYPEGTILIVTGKNRWHGFNIGDTIITCEAFLLPTRVSYRCRSLTNQTEEWVIDHSDVSTTNSTRIRRTPEEITAKIRELSSDCDNFVCSDNYENCFSQFRTETTLEGFVTWLISP